MKDDISDIADLYNRDSHNEHLRLVEHQLEFDLTMRYLKAYLPEKGNILEIGSASGRYTVALAKLGYHITAVDLSEGLIEQCRKNLAQHGLEQQVRNIHADARDLSNVPGKNYDAVLLMGPLYHLVEEEDRKLALTQAIDRLRPGGILVSAFISRFGLLGDMLKNVPEWIEMQEDVHSVIEMGRDPEDHPRGGFRGYFARVSEIAPLHETVGLETLVVAGVEPAISADDESYNKLSGTWRQLWQDILFEVSTEPSAIGASRHLLYIGKKPD